MKTAIIFAGQGSQHPKMGWDYYQNNPEFKAIFDSYPQIRDICFKSSQINETQYAQPAIFLYNYAVSSLLNLEVDYALGLSLGELNALQYANAFSLESGIALVNYRGQIMADALTDTTAMYAVIKNVEQVATIISQYHDVYISNYNSKKQVIIAGDKESLKTVVAKLKKIDCRCIPLKVSGAFHTPYLEKASLLLNDFVNKLELKPLKCSVLSNYYGDDNYDLIADNLQKQLCSAVKFQQEIEFLALNKVERIIEIGPKSVIKKLVKDTVDIEVISICSFADFIKFKENENE